MQKYEGELLHSMNKNIEGKLPKTWENKIANKEYAILLRRYFRRYTE